MISVPLPALTRGFSPLDCAEGLERSAVRHCWKEFRAGRLHWSRAWATVVLARAAEF